MSDNKSSIAGAGSYEAMGEYWDKHDLSEHWDETRPVEFEVSVTSQSTYFTIDPALSERLRESATHRGVSAETLANLWLQERVTQESAAAYLARIFGCKDVEYEDFLVRRRS